MATEDGFHGYISTGCLHTGHSEIKKPCSSLKNNAVVSEVGSEDLCRQVWACALVLGTAGRLFLCHSGADW